MTRMWSAIQRALSLGMESSAFPGLAVVGQEIPYHQTAISSRRPFHLENVLRILGLGLLSGAWCCTRWIMDQLFEASADAGDWFGALLGIDLDNLRTPRPSTPTSHGASPGACALHAAQPTPSPIHCP